MHQPRASIILPACLLLASSSAAMAADTSVFTLGEVRVTASALDAPAAAGAGATLDSETLRKFDRETVGTALNMVPGITISTVGARNEQMVYLRGFDLRQVPLFMDGIPVYVPYDGYVDLGRFNTYDLAQIDVAKGFGSLILGPNTLGGAINLISRRPVKEFEGEVGGGTSFTNRGEDNSYRAYANDGANRGSWYFQGGASYVNQHDFRLPADFRASKAEDGGLRENSYARDGKVNLKVGLTPNAQDEYALNYINQQGVKGVPPYAGNVAGVAPRFWQWPSWDKESLYFISNTAFGDGHALKLRAYYDQFRNSLSIFDNGSYTTQPKGGSAQSWYNDYTTGLSAETDWRLSPANLLKLAYHFKNDVHREHNVGQPERTFRDQTQALAAEDSHRISPALTLVAGVSYEKRETLQAQDFIANKIQPFPFGASADWNGQGGLVYKFGNGDKLSASLSSKSRFPTIKDRYSYRLGTAIPNAVLHAERAQNLELAYSGVASAGLKYELALFHDTIRDMIQGVAIAPTACPTAPCTQMQNIGKVRANGFEAGLSGAIGAHGDWGANYTYLDRRNLSNASIRLTDTPRHKLFAHAGATVAPGLTLTASVDAMSARYSSSNGAQVAPGFAVSNLKLARQFGKLTVEGGVRNLFDRLYAYSEGFYEPGRTYFIQFHSPL